MRADLILPGMLLVALFAMVVYATGESDDTAQPATKPLACRSAEHLTAVTELREASGLAASRRHPGIFWSHNDSSQPEIYALAGDGQLRARVRIAGAAVDDWEAITAGPCPDAPCLYIGDVGDNEATRRRIRVYRIPEPQLTDEASARAEVIEGAYPEGPQDAESLFVAEGALYVVTKGEGGPVRLYRFPSMAAGRTHPLQLVATLMPDDVRKTFRITDAAVSPDDRWIAMRSNDLVLFYEAGALVTGRVDPPLAYDVRPLREPQGEGLAWRDARTLYLAGEGAEGGTFARISCNLPG